jgi:MATE family multidrug resistance protein
VQSVASTLSNPEEGERIPRRFGRLWLLRRLGQGGMGEVYLAATAGIEGAERPCVVKIIRRDRARDRSFLARFVDEARVQSQLQHPGVAQVLEASTDDAGEPYVVVEYIEGRSLGEMRADARQGAMSIDWASAVAIAASLAEALGHVHERTDAAGRPLAIVHRDISPHNLMVSYSGDVKLIDFGTARAENRKSRTLSGIVLAKPGYVAPELAHGASADHRVDLYALGIVLWELVAGRRFLQGAASEHLSLVAKNERRPAPIAEATGAPRELDAIIARLTACGPHQRYASARQAASDLAQLLARADVLPSGERGLRARIGRLMQTLYPAEPTRSRSDFAALVRAARWGDEEVVSAKSAVVTTRRTTRSSTDEPSRATMANACRDERLDGEQPARCRDLGVGKKSADLDAERPATQTCLPRASRVRKRRPMAQMADSPAAIHVDTSGSPYGVILKLATPTVLAMMTQSIVNEIDIIFFAHLPSPESSNGQAALLPSLILLWVFGGSLSAISVGTQAFSARRFAERRHTDAGAVLINAVFFSVVAGLLFTVAGYAVLPLILSTFKVPGVREAASGYLHWRLLGITSMATTFAFKAFFDGIGKTHVHLVSSVIMNALNVVLCYTFIFGHFGAPRMGVAGAGLAGVVATYVGLAIMVAYALLPEYRGFHLFDWKRLSKRMTRDILRLSIPSAVATIAVMSGFALFVGIVGKLDEASGADLNEAINGAATTDVVGVLKLTFTACLAFGTSTATLVSQALGERDPDKASRFGWASVRLGILLFGILGLCEGVFFTHSILRLVSHSELVQKAALMPLRIMGICTPLIAVGMILTQALFGAGNSRYVMFVELVLHFTCLVPLAYVFGITLNGGLPGIWLAAVCYVVLLASAMVYKFASGDWKQIKL